MTLIILIFLVCGLLLLKVRSLAAGLLSVGVALVLFLNTPVGAPIPGSVTNFIHGLDKATAPLTTGGGQG